MKRFLVVFALLFVFLFPLVSQAETSMQYETITWEAVEQTRKYEINIERLNEKGKWLKHFTKQTKNTTLEVLLEPGNYRVSITTFNVLGKKTVSDWTNFYILNENTPYLFSNYYEDSNEWKVPVLYVDYKGIDVSTLTGSKYFITAESGYSENTFFIKGKNIFSPSTSFYLVPSDSPLDGGKDYVPFYTGRKEVPLKILQRDTKKSGVYVSYDPAMLFSGYYSLEARNGAEISSYGILVFADRPLEMNLEGFEHDNRYKVNALNIEGEREVELSVMGKGFTSATKFSLVPTDTGGIEYPYASKLKRNVVPINLKNKTVVNSSGLMKLDFVCNTNELKTGYYYLQADNGKNEIVKALFLAKITTDSISDMEINKISSRYNKSTKNVDITVTGKNLNKNATLSLLSAYSAETDGNNDIQISNARSQVLGTKITASVPSEELSFGNHALVFENNNGSTVAYLNIDKHYKSHMIKMDEEKAEELFLRPEEGDIAAIDFNSQIQEKVSFENDKVIVKPKMPYLFPYSRLNIGIDFDNYNRENKSIDFDFEVDLMNFRWFFIDAGVKFNPNIIVWYPNSELGIELFARFAIPMENFSPYFGVGAGYNLVDPFTGFNPINFPTYAPEKTSLEKDGFLNASDLYFIGQAGVILFQFFDFRYSLELHYQLNEKYDPYFENKFSVGARMPIRRTYYSRSVVSQGVTITKGGPVDAEDYKNLEKVTKITFDEGITEIDGFENYEKIEKINIPSTVRTLGPSVFKNCKNLESVTFNVSSKLDTIGEEAFANDTKIAVIRIPSSVVKIGKNAFENWCDGQSIALDWDSNSTVKRDLEGLENTNAVIRYLDGKPYKKSGPYTNPFSDISNWKSCVKGIGLTNTKLVYNSKVYTTINITGQIDSLTKHSSTPELVKYIKGAKSLGFKVFGDGNKYMLYAGTSDGGYYTSEFSTKKGKFTEEKINIKSLKRQNKIGDSKLDPDKIVYIQIVPVIEKDKICKAYFFDFEVDEK